MTTHTPTPWKTIALDDDLYLNPDRGEGRQYALICRMSRHSKKREANARLIVNAVNHHAAMVEALTRIVTAEPEDAPGKVDWQDSFKWAQIVARAALDAVGGGE